MISADIEKEIQQENKILLGLSIRKAAVLGVCGIIIAILVVIMGFNVAIYPSLALGVLVFILGWYKKDGLTAEMIVMKLIKDKYYKNGQRKYRTKNKYISMMNKEYKRHKNIDMNNKAIAKKMKKEAKIIKKRNRQSTMKAIV